MNLIYDSLLLDSIIDSIKKSTSVRAKCDTLQKVIARSYLVSEQFSNLKSIASVIRTCGASEGLMTCVNENNQLGNCLGISIPSITAVNASKIGKACCEAIEEKAEMECDMIVKFFKDLATSVASVVCAAVKNAECQKATLTSVSENILENITEVDTKIFDNEEIVGYTEASFQTRVNALKALIDTILECKSIDDVAKFAANLKDLGYVVEETVQVREEGIDEAKAEEPDKEEVMNVEESTDKDDKENDKDDTPADKLEDPADGGEKAQEALEDGDEPPAVDPEDDKEADQDKNQPEDKPKEDKTEVEDTPAVDNEEKVEDNVTPTDAVQTESIKTLRWTPEGVKQACASVIELLGKIDTIRDLSNLITNIINAALKKCEDKGDVNEIEKDRRYVAFLSTVMSLFITNVNELVDQIIIMTSALKKAQEGEIATDEEAEPEKNTETDKKSEESLMNWFDEDEVPEANKPDEWEEVIQSNDPIAEPTGGVEDDEKNTEKAVEVPMVDEFDWFDEDEPAEQPTEQPTAAPTESGVIEEEVIVPAAQPAGVEQPAAEVPAEPEAGIVQEEIIAPAAQPAEQTTEQPVPATVEPAEDPATQVTPTPIVDLFDEGELKLDDLPTDPKEEELPKDVEEATDPDKELITKETEVVPNEAIITEEPEDHPAVKEEEIVSPEKTDRGEAFWF